MIIIQCPSCGTKTCLSLIERSYQGPFRCWQCKAEFIIVIDHEKLKSCKPITKEELRILDSYEEDRW